MDRAQGVKVTFIWKKTCSTCRDARKLLHAKSAGRTVEERELNAHPLSAAELDALIGKRDYLAFLNTRNERYRELNMKERPPSREEALKRMAETPNLIKRPLLIHGGEIVFGFDEKAYLAALKG
jgi:Spx/MgsR family transcriptional regulator